MKVGIDSYCYHRFFGDVYDEQVSPPKKMTYAQAVGAKVMRVVGSSLEFRFEPHEPQIERLSKMFSNAVKAAEKYDIKMAVENHIDFNSDEIFTILNNVRSPYLGLNFDSGNFVRVLDDPIKAMEKLAKYVYATHIKDLRIQEGVPPDEWYFFSCTAVGDGGIVDNLKLGRLLEDAGYEGFMAVEIDFLHPDYKNNEDKAVARSIKELKRIAKAVTK
jgi:sugar phosphate isomerase/epimerase